MNLNPIPAELLQNPQTNTVLTHIRPIDAGGFGEVHAVSDSETGKVFARKVIRVSGDLPNITNEFSAIKKLCMEHTHKNIVSVLNCGRLFHFWYFIDMELCDLNLERWIYRTWDVATAKKLPHFTKELPSQVKMGQTWDIMRDISGAVAFIHSEGLIHRDLKPSNILYSLKDNAWKVTDFGLTMEGTSQKAITTLGGRGTEGYKAPELVRREPQYTYTNKVDMWAIGCIFYELVVKSKVFPEDWEVVQFAELVTQSGRTVSIGLEGHMVPGERRDFISRAIKQLLDVDPSGRPRADALYEILSTWGSDDAPQNSLFSSSTITASVLAGSPASPTTGGTSKNFLVTIREMQDKGLRYASQGRHREAAQVREELIQEQKRYLGEDHPDTLTTLHALSWSYGFLGRYAEAEQILEQVLEKRRKILGEEHASTMMTMHNLGWTYSAQGRSKEAEVIQEQVYKMRKRILGPEHIDTLHAMRNLGSTYQGLGKYEESAQILELVIETRKRILGDEHQHTLEASDGLISSYHASGRHEDARKLEEYVLQKRARILGEEST